MHSCRLEQYFDISTSHADLIKYACTDKSLKPGIQEFIAAYKHCPELDAWHDQLRNIINYNPNSALRQAIDNFITAHNEYIQQKDHMNYIWSCVVSITNVSGKDISQEELDAYRLHADEFAAAFYIQCASPVIENDPAWTKPLTQMIAQLEAWPKSVARELLSQAKCVLALQ